jgi:hypothetical protein
MKRSISGRKMVQQMAITVKKLAVMMAKMGKITLTIMQLKVLYHLVEVLMEACLLESVKKICQPSLMHKQMQ